MKGFLKKYVAITACTLVCGYTTMAVAEEEAAVEKPTAGLDMALLSKYVSRGMELSKDSVVIQPSLTIGYQGFSFNAWGNLDTNNEKYDGNKYNETDLTLSYSKTLGMVKLTGGYIYYALDAATDSQEIYGSVTLNTLLSPTITVYREIAHSPAWYILAGVSHSIELVNKITLDLGASASYFISDDSAITEANNPDSKYRALHNGLISTGLTIPLNDMFSIKPTIAYSFPLSSKADDYIEAASLSNRSDFLYGGVTLSMAF